jgi:hypothetical protein
MSDQQPSPPSPEATFTASGSTFFWDPDWETFRQKHGRWGMLASLESPLYCLHTPAITSLSRFTIRKVPWLSKEDTEAERAFTLLCEQHRAVGCWQKVQVCCPYLTGPGPSHDLRQVQDTLGWTPAQLLLAQSLLQGSQERKDRLKGYMGWLLTEPAFLQQLRQLSDRWHELPGDRRPLFPLGRINRYPISTPDEDLSSNAKGFHQDLKNFLDRWGLVQLSSWELPEPQGPLLPNLLPSNSPAIPVHGIHLVLPLHYPLQGDDTLIQQIYDFQRQAVQQLELDKSLAGLPHFRAYAALFDVLHVERVIRSRLKGSAPAGFVLAMEQAVATGLNCSLDSVKKFRKCISACQRGRRIEVPRLRLRAR